MQKKQSNMISRSCLSLSKYSKFYYNGVDLSISEEYPYVLNRSPNDDDDKKFIVSNNLFGGYYVFDRPEEFFQWCDQEKGLYRHFHEVVLEGHQRMRFDIDAPYSYPKQIKNYLKILESLMMALKIAYNKYVRVKIGREFSYGDVVVLENHRPGKYSWHVIMPELWMRNSESCLYFARKVKNLMRDEEHAKFLDLQVYKKLQCFRMEGHGKVPKTGEEFTRLEQCEFEVKGRVYGKEKRSREETLVSWYEGDWERLEACSFGVEIEEEKREKSVRGMRVIGPVASGYNASLEVLESVLEVVDPNAYEHEGREWRVFSRCVYNIWGEGYEKNSGNEEVREMWMRWCEQYHANNEEENERLWEYFGKSEARYGVPTLKKQMAEYRKREVEDQRVDEILSELCMDRSESGYPLAGAEVVVVMHGGHEMRYKLDEKGVMRIVRLNKEREISKYYLSALKAAAGGGYLVKSMLEAYHEIPEGGWVDNLIHSVKPSVRNFYSVLLSTVKRNRSQFDRVRSLVNEVHERYESVKEEKYERKENGAEAAVGGGGVVQVENMEFVGREAEKGLEESFRGSDVVYIKSPTGSGKTQAMLKWLTANREVSCCVVTQRVSLAEDLYKHFRGCGFEHYKEVDDVRNSERLIIQVESLYKLYGDGEKRMKPFDVLLLDESESLVSQFMSKNIKYVQSTRAVVKWMFQFAKKIVCMDAYMGADTVKMVRRFKHDNDFRQNHDRENRCREVLYVNDEMTERGTRVHLMNYYEELVTKMMAGLLKGQKAVFATNSVQKSREVYKMVTSIGNSEFIGREVKVALYNSDHLKEFWGDLKDVNESWKKYDVVIYTSSIETGISFTEEHFDELYGYFTPQSTNYKSSLQMLKRVRNLGNKRMNLYIKPVCVGGMNPMDEEGYDQLWQDTVGDYLKDIPFGLDHQGNKIYKDKGPFYELAMLNYQREVESRNDYFNLFLHELEKVGCEVLLEPDDHRTEEDVVKKRAVPEFYKPVRENMLKPLEEMVKYEQIQDIKHANLSPVVLNSKKGGKETKDAKTYVAIQKCLETGKQLTEEQIEKYKDESARRKLYNMKGVYGKYADEYMDEMKQSHLGNVITHNGDMQSDVVMYKNNSLKCLLAYKLFLLKLWPKLKDVPFDLNELEKTQLTPVDLARVRQNSQKEIETISRLIGIDNYRIIKDIKNEKNCKMRKIIGLINTVLIEMFDIKLESNQQRGDKVRYIISHEHPENTLVKTLEKNSLSEFGDLT